MAQTHDIGRAHTKVFDEAGKTVVRYHATNVIAFDDKEITLNSNGYRTSTTKSRINQASNQFWLHVQVFQKNFDWFVALPSGETVPFEDNMTIGRML